MPITYDIDALIEELELDREDVNELLVDFREFLEETMVDLESKVNGEELVEARALAHSLKGSAGNLRVNQIYGTAKAMQDVADAGNAAELKSLMVVLKQQSIDFLEESKDLA